MSDQVIIKHKSNHKQLNESKDKYPMQFQQHLHIRLSQTLFYTTATFFNLHTMPIMKTQGIYL